MKSTQKLNAIKYRTLCELAMLDSLVKDVETVEDVENLEQTVKNIAKLLNGLKSYVSKQKSVEKFEKSTEIELIKRKIEYHEQSISLLERKLKEL